MVAAVAPSGPARAEPRRAREPDEAGVVLSGGVEIAWEVFGSGSTTVLLLPTWSIVPSRFWKAQVPYLARHFRVVSFDGRGCGRSGRPASAVDYRAELFVADTLAVLDATGTDRAVLVAFSCGASWGLRTAAEHPDRVLGLVCIAPAVPFAPGHDERGGAFDARHEAPQGWQTYTRHEWLHGDYPGFLSFFFGRMVSEPHSTRQIEDCLAWGRQIAPATLAATEDGRAFEDRAGLVRAAERVRAPLLVVHGDADEIRPHAQGAALAELTGAELLTVAGGGHALPARHPVLVNRAIKEFAHRVVGHGAGAAPVRATWTRSLRRPQRALFVCSPIGLGHALRDVAVADALRAEHPGLVVDWLAQHPVTRVLADRGERVHPASAWLASESAHVESEAGEHDLHAFHAVRRMDETLVANFMVFADLLEREHYDLVVADEAWDIDYFLHENPELKRFAYAWMTDFVGWLPMPDGGDEEVALTADLNAEMLTHRARFRRLRDASLFVGNPDDIVPDTFGPGLPGIREWTAANFDFCGYVTGFDAAEVRDREGLRARLGYDVDHPVCVVTVGGSGVGTHLLGRVLDAAAPARRAVPGLHFVVVTGPRIDPASLPRRHGVRVVGYLPELYRHLAAADVAVVQGGLTTCMELTAVERPFVYVPLRHHFEQTFHVRHRLERYGAGQCLDYSSASEPDLLAESIARQVAAPTAYRPVESDGAARAGARLAQLL